jgi:peptidoglycan/xylan/chitin deacetylase (PgdA/CDA1 family)
MRAMLAGAMALVGLSCAVTALAQSDPEDCQAAPGMLGVSRVVEIDTGPGPRFGQLQYRDNDFLKDKEVVLTFDDGPLRPYTRPVLEALAAHCTKATFFMVGRMAVADPEMVREVARRGHTIGTHTWSHRHLNALSSQQAHGEIELGLSAVQQALGRPVAPFFRFPYLADSKSLLARLEERNIAAFSIDVDAYDYRTQSADTVHRNIVSQLQSKGKGIILFHDIQPSTARALKRLLDDLKQRGYRVVHMVPKSTATTLVEYNGSAVKELTRRASIAATDSLARRSLVWPLFQGGRPPLGAKEPAAGSENFWQDRVFRP